jgi:hypothetical protein
METMLAMGVLLLFVSLLYGSIIYPRTEQTDRAAMRHIAKDVCSDLSTAINTATYNGNGFSHVISMPGTINGKGYNVTIYAETIHVSWQSGDIYCQFRANNITYAGGYPPINLTISPHKVSNVDGVVMIA